MMCHITTSAQIERNVTTVECLSHLELKYFRAGDIPQELKKDNQVVIGRSIEYHAKSPAADNWDWQLGEGVGQQDFEPYWDVQTVGQQSFQSKAKAQDDHAALIPNSDLPDLLSDLGDRNGSLQISNDQFGPIWHPEISVFFEKDIETKQAGIPNWFYYWLQATPISVLLTIPGIPLYDVTTCSYTEEAVPVTLEVIYDPTYVYDPQGKTTYGSCRFKTDNMDKDEPPVGNDPEDCLSFSDPNQLVIVGYYDSPTIRIGQGCGYAKNDDICEPTGTMKGIHVFYSTIVHEVEHALITCEVWNYTHPDEPNVLSGYNSLWDDDDDGYKDIWEERSGVNVLYGFDYDMNNPSRADAYNSNYFYDPADPNSCSYCEGEGGPTCSAGTRYEEKRCRDKEEALQLSDIDLFDWSFSPMDHTDARWNIQGKQW